MTNPPNPTPAVPCRVDGRAPDALRPIQFQNHIAPYATGSTLVAWGNTRLICAVTAEETVPRWMKEQGVAGGWVTAEYSMLPYSTLQRKPRESTRGKIEGRTQEIQRLIGRSLRAAVDLAKLGSRTLWVDCDVLQADGGTRTAAITGACVALGLALHALRAQGLVPEDCVLTPVAAVSLGLVQQQVLVDLCYQEDAAAEVDLNLVMNARGEFIEVQGTGEKSAFREAQLMAMLEAGRAALQTLFARQQAALAPV